MNRKQAKAKREAIRNRKIESVRGERCVYCGKPLAKESGSFAAMVHSRKFHTCSDLCREATERYAQQDGRKKIWLYLILFFCSVGIIISAIGVSGRTAGSFMYGSIFFAGVGFLVFPYPITSFETFLRCPIQKVTAISRGVGSILCVLGILFFFLIR